MTLSIGPATDYLYGLAQTASSGVLVGGDAVLVVDGWPHELADGMFVVGLTDPPPEVAGDTAGTRARVSAEVGLSADTYVIPCYIDVRVPGTTTQKTARDLALTLFNNFWTLLIADLRLGGALPNGTSELTEIRAVPSNVGTAAEPGRRQLLAFAVTCIAFSG